MPDPFTGPSSPIIKAKIPTGPLGIVIGIVEFILQLFGFGQVDLKPLQIAINNTWANLAEGAAFLYNTIGSIFDFMRKVFSTILAALSHIISDILHGHLLDAIHDIQKLFHTLRDLFAPILRFIDKLRGWFYKYVYKYVNFVQNVLSAVRVILSAFRLLGAKWAAKLDADISKIQGYITGALQAIVGTLNQVSTWMNLALDPLGIVRRDFFSRSMFGSLLQTRNAINFGKDRSLFASEAQNVQENNAMAGGGAAILTSNPDGSVNYSAAMTRINSEADLAWNSYGAQPRVP